MPHTEENKCSECSWNHALSHGGLGCNCSCHKTFEKKIGVTTDPTMKPGEWEAHGGKIRSNPPAPVKSLQKELVDRAFNQIIDNQRLSSPLPPFMAAPVENKNCGCEDINPQKPAKIVEVAPVDTGEWEERFNSRFPSWIILFQGKIEALPIVSKDIKDFIKSVLASHNEKVRKEIDNLWVHKLVGQFSVLAEDGLISKKDVLAILNSEEKTK